MLIYDELRNLEDKNENGVSALSYVVLGLDR